MSLKGSKWGGKRPQAGRPSAIQERKKVKSWRVTADEARAVDRLLSEMRSKEGEQGWE